MFEVHLYPTTVHCLNRLLYEPYIGHTWAVWANNARHPYLNLCNRSASNIYFGLTGLSKYIYILATYYIPNKDRLVWWFSILPSTDNSLVDFIPNLFNIIQVIRASMRSKTFNCCWRFTLYACMKTVRLAISLYTNSPIHFTAKNRVQMSEITRGKNLCNEVI